MLYRQLYTDIKNHDPKAQGFCGPLAIAALTGLDGPGVLDYCKPYRVWDHSYGMRCTDILRVLADLTGQEPTPEKRDPRIKTIVTAQRHLPKKGKYLILVRSHVVAVVDGEVADWSEGRRLRVQSIYKVTA